jgi:hypothetical protein
LKERYRGYILAYAIRIVGSNDIVIDHHQIILGDVCFHQQGLKPLELWFDNQIS